MNILQLVGSQTPYNICRNLEWMVCAARGELPFQKSRKIRFAVATDTIEISGRYPLWKCSGFTNAPGGCEHETGYANDDIFFLETCLFNHLCKNKEELFSLRVGQDFECDFSPPAFRELASILQDRQEY